MAEIALSNFDYSCLEAKAASDLMDVAIRIKGRLQHHIAGIIRTGRELLESKEMLEHGQFLSWLALEFKWSERTAQRYMAAANAFHDKSDTVPDLPPTIIYALASSSTPEPVRAEVIQKLEEGEPLEPDDIKTMIYDARRGQAETRRLAKLTPEQRAKEKSKNQRSKARQAAFAPKLEQERATAKELGERAADRLIELIGPDLQDLVLALDGADLHAFLHRLRETFDSTTAGTMTPISGGFVSPEASSPS